MRFSIPLLAIVIALTGCKHTDECCTTDAGMSAHPKAGTDTEWMTLFNGKDLSGWRTYGKQTPPGAGWKVEDGILKKVPKQRTGDIVTEQKFNDYEFSWEWLVQPKANSGVKYLVTEERKDSPGIEYQMIDDKGYGQPLAPKHLTATFYDVLPRTVDTSVKPANEWNSSRIIVKGNHVEHWLNGVKVLEFEFGSPEVKAALAKSKFKDAPGFGEKISGHIMLTDHGDEAWFKNLKIRELK
ncbi:MAG TPA: DUF1080 domain-containing protein [Candidatus Acidoferrum sp.]|nr:DUF1080 domain-containing protein [Candidatus Acidoferrum sp.]